MPRAESPAPRHDGAAARAGAPPRLGGGVVRAFAALVVAQAAHSIEEYAFRLYDTFPPARFVTGLVSVDRARGFVIVDVALVAFGVWCLAWPVRRAWASASTIVWLWVGIELVNGVGHPLWSLAQSGYTPGVATAPVLLLAITVARRMTAGR
jgi:Protein of unknown function with HXXEE motif